jgi:glycosyltransferase involved in cell wall biosynthesis
MRILMCNSFHYLRGGAERCFLDLMGLLREQGHEVIPFSMHHEHNLPSDYERYFISHIDYPSLMGSNVSMLTRLKAMGRILYCREAAEKIDRLIRDTQPDIAHVHGIAHETSPSILPVIKRHGLPVVQTLHDYKLLCPNTSFVTQGEICERCKGGRFYNATRYRCKRGSLPASAIATVEAYAHKSSRVYERNVDRFISPSEFLARKVAAFGITTDMVTIPNFINIDSFTPVYAPEPYYVFAGRLVDVKGIRTLVRAAEKVRKGRLYIAGSGDLRKELEDYVADRGLDHITFLGHLATDKLIELFRYAAFTVTPSEWYENYPMSVLEALACGTPVIGAQIGGIPEIVRDGETGLIFPPGDVDALAKKIEYLLDNPDESIRMGRAGRDQIEQINGPASHYAATLAVYEDLLDTRRGSANRVDAIAPGELSTNGEKDEMPLH